MKLILKYKIRQNIYPCWRSAGVRNEMYGSYMALYRGAEVSFGDEYGDHVPPLLCPLAGLKGVYDNTNINIENDQNIRDNCIISIKNN